MGWNLRRLLAIRGSAKTRLENLHSLTDASQHDEGLNICTALLSLLLLLIILLILLVITHSYSILLSKLCTETQTKLNEFI